MSTTFTEPTCNDWGKQINCPAGKLTCPDNENSKNYKCSCASQDCYYINGTTSCTCNDPTTPPVATVKPSTMPPEYNKILTSWGIGGVSAGFIIFVTIVCILLVHFFL